MGGARPGMETSTPKAYRRGTHRAVPPDVTMRRLRPLMAPLGITRIANVTGLDRIGVPVVSVVRPNARSLALSQGKGLDLESARVSGLMESIELWHAERCDLDLRFGSWNDLHGRLPLADVWRLARVAGDRFHPTLRMLWAPGRNLLDDASRWLPYEVVHTDFTHPAPPGHGCFPFNSNGLASGNHPAEALCHAVCEVVERDAVALWMQAEPGQRAATRLVRDSVDDADCVELLVRFEDAGFKVETFDATSDAGIATFLCRVIDPRDESEHAGIGAGSHPARGVALSRAFTEAAQVRATYIAGARDDLARSEYTRSGRELKRWPLPGHGHGTRDFHAVPDHDAPSFEAELEWLLGQLAAIGVDEVIAVDLARDDVNVPVVRVAIPGLEGPFEENYVPGERARARGGRR